MNVNDYGIAADNKEYGSIIERHNGHNSDGANKASACFVQSPTQNNRLHWELHFAKSDQSLKPSAWNLARSSCALQ